VTGAYACAGCRGKVRVDGRLGCDRRRNRGVVICRNCLANPEYWRGFELNTAAVREVATDALAAVSLDELLEELARVCEERARADRRGADRHMSAAARLHAAASDVRPLN
jgi:hypothetical protein